jgi:hypothetical protein
MKPNKTELIPDSDLVKCWSILDQLKLSEILELKRIPEDRRDTFRECAKQYQDTHHNITFNNDLTKIRKDERITTEKRGNNSSLV